MTQAHAKPVHFFVISAFAPHERFKEEGIASAKDLKILGNKVDSQSSHQKISEILRFRSCQSCSRSVLNM